MKTLIPGGVRAANPRAAMATKLDYFAIGTGAAPALFSAALSAGRSFSIQFFQSASVTVVMRVSMA